MATDISLAADLIRSDVSKQLELSKEMAAELAEIDKVIEELETSGDFPGIVLSLRDRRNRLVHIARSLANNANTTSNSAIKIISSVTSSST